MNASKTARRILLPMSIIVLAAGYLAVGRGGWASAPPLVQAPAIKGMANMSGMQHGSMQGMANMPGMKHGLPSAASVIIAAPSTNSAIAQLSPSSTLKEDALDAPAPVAVEEAKRASSPQGHQQ